jgi:glycosyltransferase involved in cell wall biosynthesis
VPIVDLGWVGEREKRLAFEACDVFALPSLNDAFGHSFLDAWLSHKPVIAAQGAAQEDFIREGDGGFLVQPFDVVSLLEMLKRLYDCPAIRDSAGDRGSSKLSDQFSPSVVLDGYARAFVLAVERFGR